MKRKLKTPPKGHTLKIAHTKNVRNTENDTPNWGFTHLLAKQAGNHRNGVNSALAKISRCQLFTCLLTGGQQNIS